MAYYKYVKDNKVSAFQTRILERDDQDSFKICLFKFYDKPYNEKIWISLNDLVKSLNVTDVVYTENIHNLLLRYADITKSLEWFIFNNYSFNFVDSHFDDILVSPFIASIITTKYWDNPVYESKKLYKVFYLINSLPDFPSEMFNPEFVLKTDNNKTVDNSINKEYCEQHFDNPNKIKNNTPLRFGDQEYYGEKHYMESESYNHITSFTNKYCSAPSREEAFAKINEKHDYLDRVVGMITGIGEWLDDLQPILEYEYNFPVTEEIMYSNLASIGYIVYISSDKEYVPSRWSIINGFMLEIICPNPKGDGVSKLIRITSKGMDHIIENFKKLYNNVEEDY